MSGWRKLGVIAGGGELPLAIAEHCKAAALPYFVARVMPFADGRLARHPSAAHGLDEMGARIEALRAEGCDAIVFAGQVPRPDLSTFKLDAGGQALAPMLLAAAREGDDAVLRALVAFHAQAGFRVVGAEDAAFDLLAPAGVLGAIAPDASQRADILRAAHVANVIGALDIGQAVVVANGLVLGVEAQEGTDALLHRIATLPEALRGSPDARRGVLLKRPKPMQERRIDLPTVGLQTLEGADAAGLAGIAFEAGAALVLQRADLIAAADGAGLFLYGFTREEAGET